MEADCKKESKNGEDMQIIVIMKALRGEQTLMGRNDTHNLI